MMPFNPGEDVAEIIGRIISDGNIWSKNGHYEVTISGNPKEDMAYFQTIKKTYAKFGIHARIRYRQGALRIIARSKKLHQYLVKNLKMTPGKYKARKTKIPRSFERFSIPVLRGIFDGDGSIFVAKKPGIDRYPSIEITTTSKPLAKQLVCILKNKGFRPTSRHRMENRQTYKIGLNGWKNVRKWAAEIGSNNAKKKMRLETLCFEQSPASTPSERFKAGPNF